MRTQDAVAHFGSVIKLAEALGIHRSAVYQWQDTVPIGRAYQIEVLTRGALRANGSADARAIQRRAG